MILFCIALGILFLVFLWAFARILKVDPWVPKPPPEPKGDNPWRNER